MDVNCGLKISHENMNLTLSLVLKDDRIEKMFYNPNRVIKGTDVRNKRKYTKIWLSAATRQVDIGCEKLCLF